MQTKTEIDRAALIASIEKWERNAAVQYYRDITLRPEDCALCVIYFFKPKNAKAARFSIKLVHPGA